VKRKMEIKLHLGIFILVFLMIVSGGAYTYHLIENWSLFDSFYFVVITITTIGYGDLTPVTLAGRVFTMFFSFFGIAMAFYFVGIIGTNLFKNYLNKRISEIKAGRRDSWKRNRQIL
jgi:voltage-gated potassium channel